jgi:hypothetical protein
LLGSLWDRKVLNLLVISTYWLFKKLYSVKDTLNISSKNCIFLMFQDKCSFLVYWSFPPPTSYPELEFLKRLRGLGTEKEEGYRTGPPG